MLGIMFHPPKPEAENGTEEEEKPPAEGDAPIKKTAMNINETQPDAEMIAFPEG